MEINDLDKQLTKLEQIVKDGFKASDKSFKEMIAKQNYTNGNVKDNIKGITCINTEITKMKAISSVSKALTVLVIVPSISYLLVSYLDNQQKMVLWWKRISLYTRQLKRMKKHY